MTLLFRAGLIPRWPRWSALALAGGLRAASADSTTVFNELMYHSASDEVEWIELANIMAVDMDLSGWRIVDGIEFTFPEGTVIPAGGRVVVSRVTADVPGAIGPWSGRLANGGERIRLLSVSGRVMDELDFRDSGRWPCGPDGSGATLARRNERRADPGPEAWRASLEIGGTPGAPNFPAGDVDSPGLRISEIAGSSEPVFRVELVNEGTTPISLAGVTLGPTAQSGPVVAAGAVAVIEQAQLGFHPVDGDRLFLVGGNGTTLLDAVTVRTTVRARHGGRMLVPDAPTFGAPNSVTLASDVVINEIMFAAPPFPSSPGTPAVVQTTALVPLDATWRYQPANVDPGPGWAAVAHTVSSGWQEGQGLLGFESTPDVLPEPLRTAFTPIGAVTHYFETDFSLTTQQIAEMSALRVEHVIDDGAVFYLNGVELPGTRFNLPDGTVGHTTPTTAGVGNAVVRPPVDVPAAGLSLQPGWNRLSIEVHQQIATSNDLVCGVRLSAVLEISPAVPAQPVRSNPEEWIELHNQGAGATDLSGWRFDDGVSFDFPAGTVIASGGFLVVARDAAALAANWPERGSSIIGGFAGSLANDGERIELLDARGNPVDEVTYCPGRWSDGGGSTLELRDPRSDNRGPHAWADSDESAKSEWQSFSARPPTAQRFGPTTWNEMRIGLLDAGECLIDDLRVVRDPDGAAVDIIQNGNFEELPTGSHWRFLGNHGRSEVIADPGNPGNRILRIAATGPTETNHNHLESTFLNNQALSTSADYEVRFSARWLAGTSHLNTRAYYQKLARTWELPIPSRLGTPGAINSRVVANAGPVVHSVGHVPAVPPANSAATVSLGASDPDGVGSAMLHYRVGGAATFTSVPMTIADGRWVASLPGQPAGTIAQFYATVTDTTGVESSAPPLGAGSRALVQWRDNQGSALPAHQLRLIMLPADRTLLLDAFNRLSNDRIPGTLVYRESEIVYDVGVRLQGTAAGRVRDGDQYIGYDIGFPRDRLFRGVHESIGIDRSGRTPVVRRQDEIYVRHTFNRAGIPCTVDDLCHFIAPTSGHTGTAILQLASYGSRWVSSQFEETEGIGGTVFNWDVTYDPTGLSTAGNPESLKTPVPFIHVGTDLTDLGDDPEQYRGPFDIRAGKRRDDYTGLIALGKTMALPSAQLAVRAHEVLDLDEAFRCTALVNLWGIADTYFTGGLPHNIRLFVPDGGAEAQLLPWDLDFVMNAGTTSALMPSGNNLAKLITANPGHRRRYLSHVRHLCETVFNTSYLTPWLNRYGSVVGQNFGSTAGYVSARRNYALTQMPAATPFAITTNGGQAFSTSAATTTLEGTAWVDILDLRVNGIPVALAWPTLTRWQASFPLAPGVNEIVIHAHGPDSATVGSQSIAVTRLAETDSFPAWRQRHFSAAELADPAISGPLADPLNSGLPNLLRYAFGLAPGAAARPSVVGLTHAPGLLRFEFPRLKNAVDLDYVPEATSGSGAWSPLPGTPTVVRDHGDGTETVQIETAIDGSAKLLRLRVQVK